MPIIEESENLSPEDRAAIVMPLDEFSRARGFVWQPEEIALLLRDEGKIIGGLIGQCLWGWLRIEILGVTEQLRGQGWGRRLVEKAEDLARTRGCHHAWVDTFSFQSRPFYERLGYQVFGQLADYPNGQTRYFLEKSLIQKSVPE